MTMAGLTAAFGLPYSSQFVLSGPHSCCDSGAGQLPRSPHTSAHVCSCQLEQVLQQKMNATSLPLTLFPHANFPTEPNLMFGPTAREPTGVYSPLVRQCDIKGMNNRDGFNARWYASNPRFDHHNFDQPANYLACHRFGDRFSPIDLNSGARRKNATRETTSTLKAWLYEHQKNPYPTKGEKIMLAILTKMTLTQVSTWFANARRRLKKENKMTWSPRNRSGERKDSEGYSDEDDAVDEDDDEKSMEDLPDKRENVPCQQTTVIKTAEDANNAVSRRDPVLSRLTNKIEALTPEQRLQNPDSTNTTPERTDPRIIWLNERSTTNTETDSPQHTSSHTSSLDDSPVKSLRKWVDGCFDERRSGPVHSPMTDTPPLTPPACETERLPERLVHATKKQNSSPARVTPPPPPSSTTFDISLTKDMEERSSDYENDAATNRENDATTNREIDAALALTTLFSRS